MLKTLIKTISLLACMTGMVMMLMLTSFAALGMSNIPADAQMFMFQVIYIPMIGFGLIWFDTHRTSQGRF